MKYVLGIDQSTQGTKAILMDASGQIAGRADRPHRQIISEEGWVSHDLNEIYDNVLAVVRDVLELTKISPEQIAAIGISNQRETTAIWDRNGTPLAYAVVWQCSRAKEIAQSVSEYSELIRDKTGLELSPYFPAAKMAWLLRNTDMDKAQLGQVCLGTMDTWLIYRMTHGAAFKTDYSNASRTQLFSIRDLQWDKEICDLFGIPMMCLPEVCDSNSVFGMTDLEGLLPGAIPIHSAIGDSHAALFGQGCHSSGKIKTTYGTGSSIMMNIGKDYVKSSHGLVTSLAWGIDGQVDYVLEGNINYTGAVISWLKDDVKLITSPAETESAVALANPLDETILVPAFSGLSAPYWNNTAKAVLYGMSRTTGRNEIIKAALESIAFQINAVLEAMVKDSGIAIREVRVDGGPTGNKYLMQLQSDLSRVIVAVANIEELSAAGAAYLAGLGAGIYEMETLFGREDRKRYMPAMDEACRQEKLSQWDTVIGLLMR